ncbi:hypothetical protein PR202_ga24187 [Eleusine coracana subsp. coracana]|uniref:GDSL esterase/lipase n=1 Tax=Eleusine coracana subsp. coracana TaxID=191504 RepID=A0AAV5D8H0_ELECO|nr:hypothetical protein PR202_ga24187 [Eleusine coracana subsp. coracana]
MMRCRGLLLAVCCALVALVVSPRAAVAREYVAIFNFGDSLADAGNLCVDGIPDYLVTARPPYGQTYFGYPTGRVSDGRVVIDFIGAGSAAAAPVQGPERDVPPRGANFAITGATSLDTAFFHEHGLGHAVWNSDSLHAQIKWFQDMKPAICNNSTQECRDLFRRSLFIVGEFGGNDYAAPLFAFRPLEEAHAMIPHVVDSIGRGVEKLIGEGAVDLVVPGVLPTGCFPVVPVHLLPEAEPGERKIAELRKKHPGVRIVYADYYTPAVQFVLHAEKWGEFILLSVFARVSDRCSSSAMAIGEHDLILPPVRITTTSVG